MSLKAKQRGLFNVQFASTFKTKGCVLFIKYITLFVSLLFSLNSFAVGDVGDILRCNERHTWERYHNLHRLIKERTNFDKNNLVHNLAKTSLCLGEAEEGMDHLQTASDLGHIPAILLLGTYYRQNQTFSSSEVTNNLEDLNKAIYYHKRGISMIEELPNYPEGSTNTDYVEYRGLTSVYLFIGLPALYFRGYAIAIGNMMKGNKEEKNDNKEEVFYNDTLTVLSKIGEAATNCLERPALDIWKEKKEIVYEDQQTKCSAYLEFVEAAYSVEQQRLEADKNCQVPLKECAEHKKIFDKLTHLVNTLFSKANSVTAI